MKDKAGEKPGKAGDKKKADKKDQKNQKLSKDYASLKSGKKKKNKKDKKHSKEKSAAVKSDLVTDLPPKTEESKESAEVRNTRKESSRRPEEQNRIPVVTGEKNKEKSRQDLSCIYRALGDENRLQILELLREEEMCAADLLKLVSVVQSTLSHHMKILCESGLVICRRQARWSYYTVNKQLFAETADCLKKWSE